MNIINGVRRGTTITAATAALVLTAGSAFAGGGCPEPPKKVTAPAVIVTEGSVLCVGGDTPAWQLPTVTILDVPHVQYTVDGNNTAPSTFQVDWGSTHVFDAFAVGDYSVVKDDEWIANHTFGAKPPAPKGCEPEAPPCVVNAKGWVKTSCEKPRKARVYFKNKCTSTGQATAWISFRDAKGRKAQSSVKWRRGPCGEKSFTFKGLTPGTRVEIRSGGELLGKARVKGHCPKTPGEPDTGKREKVLGKALAG